MIILQHFIHRKLVVSWKTVWIASKIWLNSLFCKASACWKLPAITDNFDYEENENDFMKPKFHEDQYVFIHEIKKFFDLIIENINNPVTTQKEYFKSEFIKDLGKYNKRMEFMHSTMKNSFNGTGIDLSKCEKNFQKVKKSLEKVSPCPEWTDWSSWGSCSKSCGHAYKKRSRNYCIETDCIETEEDTRICDLEGCEFYYIGYLFGIFFMN